MRRLPLVILLLLLVGCATPYQDVTPYVPPLLRDTPPPAPPAELPDPDAVLSVEDCVALTLATHRKVAIQDRRILIARDRLHESLGLVLPQVGAEATYTARNSEPSANFGGMTVPTGETEVVSGRLGMLVPVYDSGRAWHAFEAANLGIETAELGARLARQELALAARSSYYRVLEAERIREVVQDSIAVVQRQLEVSQDLHAQGLVGRSDILTVEVRLGERRQELVRAEHNVELARATLNRLLGLDVTHSTRLAPVLELSPQDRSLADAVRRALEQRQDLALLDRQVDLSQARWRATRSNLGPRFFAFGDYVFTSDEFLSDRDWLQGGLGVQVPLFDGGVTYAQLQRQEREIAEALDQRNERVDDITLEVQRALLQVREAAEQVPIARQNVELARENLRVASDRYREGLATSVDVLIEEERLARARARLYTSLYDHHAALARLRFVLGEPEGTTDDDQ
jgi:outer membrane protein TolC